ncbi:hypothetical protein ED21_23163 [Erythrobacter sp. SD-21]|nr:hypothetical protein ED21_23163 [Erythrobacter sp. SD-21]
MSAIGSLAVRLLRHIARSVKLSRKGWLADTHYCPPFQRLNIERRPQARPPLIAKAAKSAAKDRNSKEQPPQMHWAAKLSKNQTKSITVEANQNRQTKIPVADGPA